MTAIELALACATCVYAVIAAASLRMAGIRRLGREYGHFAGLAAGLVVACLGELLTLAADSASSARHGVNLEVAGVLVGLGAFSGFVHASANVPVGALGRMVLAFVVVSLACVAAGILFDPSHPVESTLALGPYAYPRPTATALGKANSLVGVALCIALTVRVVPAATTTRAGKLLQASCIVAVAGWSLRTGLYFADASVAPLFGLILAPFVSAIAAALLLRWGDVDEELRKRNVELLRAYEQLEDAQSELVRREQLAAVGELSAVIAHEVRNPLAVLKNAVSGLRRDNLTPDLRETLHSILDQETDRLNRLVRDLLAYARPIHLAIDDVEVAPLVERALAAATAGHPGLDVDVEVDLDVWETIRGDRDQLERALAQLLDNAYDAVGSVGTVHVIGRKAREGDHDFVHIAVVDSGEGMDTLIRSRAKEPFFTTRKEGTGLGLAIVERVAASHGGRLELERDAGGGTRAVLHLPREEQRRTRSSLVPV